MTDDAFFDRLAEAIVARLPKPESTESPVLIDGNELAMKLGVSRPTIDRYVKRNKIPSIKLGKCRKFRLDQVLVALENK